MNRGSQDAKSVGRKRRKEAKKKGIKEASKRTQEVKEEEATKEEQSRKQRARRQVSKKAIKVGTRKQLRGTKTARGNRRVERTGPLLSKNPLYCRYHHSIIMDRPGTKCGLFRTFQIFI